MTILGIDASSCDKQYGYQDCAVTHVRPEYVAECARELNNARQSYLAMTDCNPLPYGELEEAMEEIDRLEKKFHTAWNAWKNGDDPEYADVPF